MEKLLSMKKLARFCNTTSPVIKRLVNEGLVIPVSKTPTRRGDLHDFRYGFDLDAVLRVEKILKGRKV